MGLFPVECTARTRQSTSWTRKPVAQGCVEDYNLGNARQYGFAIYGGDSDVIEQ